MKSPEIVLLILLLISGELTGQTPELAAKKLNAFVDKLPSFAPGYALVIVTSDKVLLSKTSGVLRDGLKSKLTSDTPLYVASLTKSYVGLLAACLHKKNILRLDDKISDHWPDLRLPKGQASAVHLGDLLNHVVPFKVGYITLFETSLGEIRPEMYPFVIEKHAVAKPNDFVYDNYGYNIWAAILENATGKDWRVWLKEIVLDELELQQTFTQHSELKQDTLPWRHVWRGKDKGWFALPPKTDLMMNSAGGISTSANDLAKWLQAHLHAGKQEERSKPVMLDGAVYEIAHRSGTGNRKLSPKYEFERTGYSLGWNICQIDGKTWHVHGGGLTGVRSISAFCRELNLGFAFVANSDHATSWLCHRTLAQFLLSLSGSDKEAAMAKSRVRSYQKRADYLFRFKQQQIAERDSDPGWSGWKWKPTKAELTKYCGVYQSDPSFGQRFQAKVFLVDDDLRMKFGEQEFFLKPARLNLFGAAEFPDGYAVGTRFYFREKEDKPYQMSWNRGKTLYFRLRRMDQ